MQTRSALASAAGMTEQEIAKRLSAEEGRVVTAVEIYRIECQALRKLRMTLNDRGISYEALQIPLNDQGISYDDL